MIRKEPAVTELVPAAQAEVPAIPSGPVCGACRLPAVVNWRRRPTPAELAHHVHAEKGRREEALLLADPQQPAPVFPPLPTADDTTITVYACADHAIDIDAAALIHHGACTAPNQDGIDGCDCTPEPHPEPAEDPTPSRLPAHWQTGGA